MSKYGGAKPKAKKSCSSVPSSNRGSFEACPHFIPAHMQGQLTRDILSADFDALFAWAKERETYEHDQGVEHMQRSNNNPRLALNDQQVQDDFYLQEYSSIGGSRYYGDNKNSVFGNQLEIYRPHSVIGTLTTEEDEEDCFRNQIEESGDIDNNYRESESRDHSKPSRFVLFDKKKKPQPPSPATLRSYKITAKGLVKDKDRKSAVSSRASNTTTSVSLKKKSAARRDLKVALIGEYGVGKRELVREFLTPDEALYSSIDSDEDGEKSVSILLDGEESTLEFVDLSLRQSDTEVGREDSGDQVDAYVVVYSVEDRKSFETAIDRLFDIREKYGKEVAVILVANKTDLVRTRVIHEEEGKSAAKTYDCKYIEVSAAIDHKIDELLVGILKQIRLMKDRRQQRQQSVDGKDSCCPIRAKQSVLGKLFGKSKRQTKSCENLYVL